MLKKLCLPIYLFSLQLTRIFPDFVAFEKSKQLPPLFILVFYIKNERASFQDLKGEGTRF